MGQGGQNYNLNLFKLKMCFRDLLRYYLKAKFLPTKIAKRAFYVSCGIPARKQQQGKGSVGANLISIYHVTSLNELQ